MTDAACNPHRQRLTAAQLQVVALYCAGLGPTEIAARLGITYDSVYARMKTAKIRQRCQTNEQLMFVVGRTIAREIEEAQRRVGEGEAQADAG